MLSRKRFRTFLLKTGDLRVRVRVRLPRPPAPARYLCTLLPIGECKIRDAALLFGARLFVCTHPPPCINATLLHSCCLSTRTMPQIMYTPQRCLTFLLLVCTHLAPHTIRNATSFLLLIYTHLASHNMQRCFILAAHLHTPRPIHNTQRCFILAARLHTLCLTKYATLLYSCYSSAHTLPHIKHVAASFLLLVCTHLASYNTRRCLFTILVRAARVHTPRPMDHTISLRRCFILVVYRLPHTIHHPALFLLLVAYIRSHAFSNTIAAGDH